MFHRIIQMFTQPEEYWREAIAEPGDLKYLFTSQVFIAIAIASVSQSIGTFFGMVRFSFGGALTGALFTLVLSFGLSIGVWIGLGHIIDMLAIPFGAQKDLGQSMKLATGAVIPPSLGAALHVTSIASLGTLGSLVGLGYGAYLLYLGMPVMNGVASDKAVAYTAASIGILLVLLIMVSLFLQCPMNCLFNMSVPRI